MKRIVDAIRSSDVQVIPKPAWVLLSIGFTAIGLAELVIIKTSAVLGPVVPVAAVQDQIDAAFAAGCEHGALDTGAELVDDVEPVPYDEAPVDAPSRNGYLPDPLAALDE